MNNNSFLRLDALRMPILRDDEGASLNHLIEAFSGHFDCRALPQRLQVAGLCCPPQSSSRAGGDCRVCKRACAKFPIELVLDVGLCLSRDEIKAIIESRPGGKDYFISTTRLFKLLGKGCCRIRKHCKNPHNNFLIIHYDKQIVDKMENFLQICHFKAAQLNPGEVLNAIMQSFAHTEFPNQSASYLSEISFDLLKAKIGLPIKDDFLDPEAVRLENLHRMVNGVMDTSCGKSLKQIRRLVSPKQMENPPIQQVIESGVLPKVIEYLQSDDNAELQLDAVWILTNLTSGETEHTQTVVGSGVVPHLIHLLGSPDEATAEQAARALGNIAGDGPTTRDVVLQAGAVHPLLQLLHQRCRGEKVTSSYSYFTSGSMTKTATWTLKNFCIGKPRHDSALVWHMLPTVIQLMTNSDEEVMKDACWALSYLTCNVSDDIIQEVIDAVNEAGAHLLVDSCNRNLLVDLLLHPSTKVQRPVLMTAGNIVSSAIDLHTQYLIDNNVLPSLLVLLSSSSQIIVKEACWAISNITAGNEIQIQAVIDSGVIPSLIRLLGNEKLDIRKECVWAISNLTFSANVEQVKYVVQQGCIRPLYDCLTVDNAKVVTVVLDGLANVSVLLW